MKYFIIIASLFFSFSCASQKKEIISKSTIKLEGKNTNIRDLLDIDGFYSSGFIFFEDGTWVSFSLNEFDGDSISNLFNHIDTWVKGNQIRWGGFWGVYSLQNDTIVVHSYDKGNLLKGWMFDEIRYKIIDRQTIQVIYSKGLLEIEEQYYKANNISPWRKSKPLHFTPIDTMPPSDCWLKEEKWIWRNESDWEAYMQKIKQKKIKRK